MTGKKYYQKSNITEKVLFTEADLLLWEIVNINDTGNGFITCDLEADDPKIEGSKLKQIVNYRTIGHRHIKNENFIEIMELITEIQDGIESNIEKIKSQILK